LSLPGALVKNVSYIVSLLAIGPSLAGNCSMWASVRPEDATRIERLEAEE
jgi:hypothetical protein